jgi:hypothetical protein
VLPLALFFILHLLLHLHLTTFAPVHSTSLHRNYSIEDITTADEILKNPQGLSIHRPHSRRSVSEEEGGITP